MDYQEKVEEIKEKVGRKTLYIGCVPEKIKTRFKQLAKEEFEENYGLLLKKLIEVYDGFYPSGHEEIEGRIDLIADAVAEIQEKLTIKKEEQPKRRMVSGRKI